MVLTAHDPSRYTFYSYGPLRHGYERCPPGGAWPKGSMGDVYADVRQSDRALGDFGSREALVPAARVAHPTLQRPCNRRIVA
jgi:hypothetical protein